eukprot:g2826.t1
MQKELFMNVFLVDAQQELKILKFKVAGNDVDISKPLDDLDEQCKAKGQETLPDSIATTFQNLLCKNSSSFPAELLELTTFCSKLFNPVKDETLTNKVAAEALAEILVKSSKTKQLAESMGASYQNSICNVLNVLNSEWLASCKINLVLRGVKPYPTTTTVVAGEVSPKSD